MRAKVGEAGLSDKLRQQGYDLTWYIEGLCKTLDFASSRAETTVHHGLLRVATIRAYNEALLNWAGEDDKNPMASVQISGTTVKARRNLLYTDLIVAFMLDYHDQLTKLGIGYDDLMECPFGFIADLRAALDTAAQQNTQETPST